MNYEELLEKYQALLVENRSLKEEIKSLMAKLDFLQNQAVFDENSSVAPAASTSSSSDLSPELFCHEAEKQVDQSIINSLSDSTDKIKLFMSLFKGRDDVYAKRWENKKKGTSGLCRKPTGICAGCPHKAYATLEEKVIEDHLRGRTEYISRYLAEKGIGIIDLRNIANKPLREELIKLLMEKPNLSLRGIAATLGLNREMVRKSNVPRDLSL